MGRQPTSEIDADALELLSPQTYVEHIKTLSSDAFQGRLPGSEGETKTIAYIKEQFQQAGLKPGNGDKYFQEVPLVEVKSIPDSSLTIEGEKGKLRLSYPADYVVGSRIQDKAIDIKDSELIFVGFGIVAPEYDWNDYKDIDVKGKTVVVMVNDPGYYDKSLFKGETMTYYGRWTYKYEEAARQGAAGVIIIHDTGAASYGWDVVRSGWTGPQMVLSSEGKGPELTAFEGWISTESAKKLFALAEIPEEFIESAKKPGFKAVDLKLQTTLHIQNKIKQYTSNNVLGKIEGSKRPDEVIIYSAHWDHLGIGEAIQGDSIYNGAIDNATGTAALLEMAKVFRAAAVPPERTILFLALTAEEQGLLGSEYYASHPVFSLDKTVADINIDALSAEGRTKDITIIGYGQSELDHYAEEAAEFQGRRLTQDPNPSSGAFFRSDHFNFAKVGVPALYAGSGTLYTDTSAVAKHKRSSFEGTYHSPNDEYNPENWEISGLMENLKFFIHIGYALSMETTFPTWKAGSEFKETGKKRFE